MQVILAKEDTTVIRELISGHALKELSNFSTTVVQ